MGRLRTGAATALGATCPAESPVIEGIAVSTDAPTRKALMKTSPSIYSHRKRTRSSGDNAEFRRSHAQGKQSDFSLQRTLTLCCGHAYNEFTNIYYINRSDGTPWQPTSNTRICSTHFVGNAIRSISFPVGVPPCKALRCFFVGGAVRGVVFCLYK